MYCYHLCSCFRSQIRLVFQYPVPFLPCHSVPCNSGQRQHLDRGRTLWNPRQNIGVRSGMDILAFCQSYPSTNLPVTANMSFHDHMLLPSLKNYQRSQSCSSEQPYQVYYQITIVALCYNGYIFTQNSVTIAVTYQWISLLWYWSLVLLFSVLTYLPCIC